MTPDTTVYIQHAGTNIYQQETLALIAATLIAPERAVMCSDNRALVFAVRTGYGRALPWDVSLALFILSVYKTITIKWIPTTMNPADTPSRAPPHTFFTMFPRGRDDRAL